MIYVYSQAMCQGCEMLKGQLKQASIPFTEVRVDQEPGALNFMKSQSHRSVPQVYAFEDGAPYSPIYIGTKLADVQEFLNKPL